MKHAWTVAAIAAGLTGAAAAQEPARRLYRLHTETGMPHLEWNLRYAVVDETRCLSRDELATAFWMMRDVSLQDCTLLPDGPSRWRLQCSAGHGTSGQAEWQWDAEPIRGQLDVRLGGKNMTFWQRISASDAGACR